MNIVVDMLFLDSRGINIPLWERVQRLVYPKRTPSKHGPFPRGTASPKKRPASWLYWELHFDYKLRQQVFP